MVVCNGSVAGSKNYSDIPTRPLKNCDNMSIRLDITPAMDGQMDRIGKTISHSACIACSRAIKRVT